MLRLMTYNVHGCVGVDGKLDVGRIAAVIGQARPDIVALQELDVGRTRSGRVDQAHEIASRLGMRFHFNCAFRVEEEQYGDALLTTLPERLVRAGPLPTLPYARLERRGALWVAVETAAGSLQVVNTHLGLAPPEQRRQVANLLSEGWLGHPQMRAPVVLLGDFNATSRYAAYRMLASRLRDVQRGPGGERLAGASARTFPSRAPMLRIDHMFVSSDVEVVATFAVRHPLARRASDHLPLVADIRLHG